MKRGTISLSKYALKNITRNAFRSTAVFMCAVLIAGSVLATMLIVRGAVDNLELSLQRLGADLIVVPWGTFVQRYEHQDVRMMTQQTTLWMLASDRDRLLAVEGVREVSPQLFLAMLLQTPYTAKDELYLIAYDPATDFTIKPWLVQPGMPQKGEAVAGSEINLSIGDQVTLFGYDLTIVNRLEPTTTDADQTLFITFETAMEFASSSTYEADTGVRIFPERVSAFLVMVEPGVDPARIHAKIFAEVDRVKPLESDDMLQSERDQLVTLVRSQWILLAIICILSVLIVGLVYTLVVNERHQEIGALRAIGARRTFILQAILTEGAALALTGGITGIILIGISAWALQDALAAALGFPLPFPPLLTLLGMCAGGLLMALASVTLGASYPALRITRLEASISMRE